MWEACHSAGLLAADCDGDPSSLLQNTTNLAWTAAEVIAIRAVTCISLLCQRNHNGLVFLWVLHLFPEAVMSLHFSGVHTRTGDSRFTRFRYPRFYFTVMRSINILPAVTLEAAAQAHWVVLSVSLTRPTILLRGLQTKVPNGFWLRKSTGMLYVSRFRRRFAGTQPQRAKTVTCIV
jgi:hypothetical protein